MDVAIPISVIALLAYLAAVLALWGRRKAGYRHAFHTISELGEVGSPNQQFIGYGVFLPIGAALLGIGALLLAEHQALAGLAFAIGVGYAVAAFFPCDPGSPVVGSLRQTIHNIGGGIEYGGGGIALMRLADDFDRPFRAGGFIVLLVLVLLTVYPTFAYRGAIQRIAEVTLFGLLAVGCWRVLG